MRAMFYMDLARMFQYTYKGNEDKVTVPIVTEKTLDFTNNPRATNNTTTKSFRRIDNESNRYC